VFNDDISAFSFLATSFRLVLGILFTVTGKQATESPAEHKTNNMVLSTVLTLKYFLPAFPTRNTIYWSRKTSN
jgi:hypothetical protein